MCKKRAMDDIWGGSGDDVDSMELILDQVGDQIDIEVERALISVNASPFLHCPGNSESLARTEAQRIVQGQDPRPGALVDNIELFGINFSIASFADPAECRLICRLFEMHAGCLLGQRSDFLDASRELHEFFDWVRKAAFEHRSDDSPALSDLLRLLHASAGRLDFSDSALRFHFRTAAKFTVAAAIFYRSTDGGDFYSAGNFCHGLISELVGISREKMKTFAEAHRSISSKSPFPCCCTYELWRLVYNMTPSEQFWPILVENFWPASASDQAPILQSDRIRIMAEAGDDNNNNMAYWWLVAHLYELAVDTDDAFHVAVEKSLATFVKSIASNRHEAHRSLTGVISALLRTSERGPRAGVLSELLNYFLKNANENFREHVATLDGYAVIPSDHAKWLRNIDDLQAGLRDRDVFCLYLRLVDTHLRSTSTKKEKVRGQYASRLRSRLPSNKWGDLTDVGVYNVYSLFLTILKASGNSATVVEAALNAVVPKQPAKEAFSQKLLTCAKGLAAMFVVQMENLGPGDEAEYKVLRKTFDALVGILESQHHPSLWRIFVDLIADTRCLSSHVFLAMPKIASPRLVNYLKNHVTHKTGESEASTIIKALVSIVTKLRQYSSEIERGALSTFEVTIKKDIDENLVAKLHDKELLFNALRTSLASSLTAPSETVAKLVVGLMQLPANRLPDTVSRNVEHFATSSLVNARVACHFIHSFLQSPLTRRPVDIACLIRGWLRCGLLLHKHPQLNLVNHQIWLLVKAHLSIGHLMPDKMEDAADPVLKFVQFVGVLATKANHEQSRTKILADTYWPYIKVIVDVVCAPKKPADLASRFLNVAAVVVRYCSSLLYSKYNNRLEVILKPLLADFFSPSFKFKENTKTAMAHVVFGILRAAPSFENETYLRSQISQVLLNANKKFGMAVAKSVTGIVVNSLGDDVELLKKFNKQVSDALGDEGGAKSSENLLKNGINRLQHVMK